LARELESRIEPTSLQLGSWSVDMQRLLFGHPAYALTHDIEGLKGCLDALERKVAEGMELGTRVDITRAEIHRERAEHDQALAILEPLVSSLDVDDFLFRQWASAAAAQTALEAYRYDLARQYAEACLEAGRDPETRILLPWLRCQRVLGLADDAQGRSAEAAERLEAAIEIAEAADCPVLAGELHEARARVAFAAGDRFLFEIHRGKCAGWLRPTENPGLIAVVERLVELDRESTVRPVDPRRRRPGASTTETSEESTSASEAETVASGSDAETRIDEPVTEVDEPVTVAESPAARAKRGEG
jgi:tetratricopeptide (TPR) repeat protein